MKRTLLAKHMKRALENLERSVKAADLLIEVNDARVPNLTSPSPRALKSGRDKRRIRLLNKADLANPTLTKAWVERLAEQEIEAYPIAAASKQGLRALLSTFRSLAERQPVRAVVIGVPNVGKSTLINSLSHISHVRTGARPGITRGVQWVNVTPKLRLLDTPGILKEIDMSQEDVWKLACTGILPPAEYDPAEAALRLIGFMLREDAGQLLQKGYGLDSLPDTPLTAFEEIALKRGCLAAGGSPDLERAAVMVISDFNKGLLGRHTLEKPGE